MNAPDFIKLPPHSIEAEQSLIGGLLIGGESSWDRIADVVAEGDFYRDDHRRIFRHIGRMVQTGKTVEAAHQAATSPLNAKPQPTPAQIEAGTYSKGHVKLHGLDISIENPKGSIRRGTDPTGRAWETRLENNYGYIKRTLAKDGDHVDVFIGERPESTRAFVIDQVNPKTGKYDEANQSKAGVPEGEER